MYLTYLPPSGTAIAEAIARGIPCARCGKPPEEHPFDLMCPAAPANSATDPPSHSGHASG